MMRSRRIGLLLLSLLSLPALPAEAQTAPVAERAEESPVISSVMRTVAAELLADSVVLRALRVAAAGNDELGMDAIIQRDVSWRQQAKRGNGPLLDAVMQGDLSRHLALARVPRQSLLADLILTDDRGLLLAATRMPSDYDQSDEAKFKVPFSSAPGTVHAEQPAYDESADDYVVTASILLTDPANGRPLGVICANFALAALIRDR